MSTILKKPASRRLVRAARLLRAGTAALLLCALLAAMVLPQGTPTVGSPGHARATLAPRGVSAPLPVINERHDRPVTPAGREFCLTLPPGVLHVGPVVFGTIVLPVREEPTLRSCFVYTQTTSSRL